MSELALSKVKELSSIEPSKAEKIRTTFEPMAEMLTQFEGAYNEIVQEAEKEITKDVTTQAKRLRIDIGRVRIETGKIKDKQKEYIKLEDRAIMGVHNLLVWAVKEKEDKLKEIENHFEIQEQKRLEELQRERVALLEPYVEDASERRLSDMDEDVWRAYLSTKKKEYEDRIKAEEQAEKERQDWERVQRLHNERKESILDMWILVPGKYKSENFGDLTESSWNKIVAETKSIKEKNDAEHERIRKEHERLREEHKEMEAKAEKERKEREAELAKERKERERLEAAEQERKAKEEQDRKEREKAAKAPVKKRLSAWVESFELPELPGEEHEVADTVMEKFNSFKGWAKEQISNI